MEENDKPVHWSKWSVVLPVIGVAITGGALWYNNFFGAKEEISNSIEINQSASDNAVNVGGANTGVINTGGVNGDDQ